jgi:hypothetical protein
MKNSYFIFIKTDSFYKKNVLQENIFIKKKNKPLASVLKKLILMNFNQGSIFNLATCFKNIFLKQTSS